MHPKGTSSLMVRARSNRDNGNDIDSVALFCLRDEYPFDEFVDIPVENRIDVAEGLAAAGVFDLLVGLEDVGADLVSPADVAFFDAVDFGLFFGHFVFVKAGLEHLHGGGFVFVLAAVVLALDDDAGGFVGDPDG